MLKFHWYKRTKLDDEDLDQFKDWMIPENIFKISKSIQRKPLKISSAKVDNQILSMPFLDSYQVFKYFQNDFTERVIDKLCTEKDISYKFYNFKDGDEKMIRYDYL